MKQLINKDTKETFSVVEEIYGGDTFTARIEVNGESTLVEFTNTGLEGNLENELWAIRQEDGSTVNNDGTVTNEGVEVSAE